MDVIIENGWSFDGPDQSTTPEREQKDEEASRSQQQQLGSPLQSKSQGIPLYPRSESIRQWIAKEVAHAIGELTGLWAAQEVFRNGCCAERLKGSIFFVEGAAVDAC